ncbi:hypothetical protein Asn12ST33_00350 [Cutibacterium acnes]|nr:hypothetical protein Asn12ST33_00350 [Cutibacterium acnes]
MYPNLCRKWLVPRCMKNSRINDFFRYWRTLLTPFRFGGYGRVITVPVALPSTDFRKALATSADFTAGKPGKNSS